MGRKEKKSAEIVALNVSLPARLKDWVEQKADEGGFSSASEYIRLLIRADKQTSAENERLEKLIVEASVRGKVQEKGSPEAIRLREAFDLMRLALEMARMKGAVRGASSSDLEQRLEAWKQNRSGDEHPGFLEESVERKQRLLRGRH